MAITSAEKILMKFLINLLSELLNTLTIGLIVIMLLNTWGII